MSEANAEVVEQVDDVDVDTEPMEGVVDEPQVSAEVTAMQEQIKGLESAVSAERKTRQEAQRESAYHAGLAQGGQATQQPTVDKGHGVDENAFWSETVGAVDKIVDHKVKQAVSKIEQDRVQRQGARIDRQSKAMSKKHEDYKGHEQSFIAQAQNDPELKADALAAPNTAAYIYEWGKSRAEAAKSGGAADTRIAELEAKIAKLTGEPVKQPPPTTQAGKRSAGKTSGGGAGSDPWAKDW